MESLFDLPFCLQELLYDDFKTPKVQILEKILDLICKQLDPIELPSLSSCYSKSIEIYQNYLASFSMNEKRDCTSQICKAFAQMVDYPPLFSQYYVNHLVVDFDSTCTEKDTT